jgi:Protein of unknown function (DUF3829)
MAMAGLKFRMNLCARFDKSWIMLSRGFVAASKNVFCLLLLCAIAAPAVGCKKVIQAMLRRDGGAELAAESSSGAGSAHDQLGEKLQGYLECYNAINSDVLHAMESYEGWLKDPEKGPSGKEANVHGIYKVEDSDLQTCRKSLAASVKMKPSLVALEKSGQDYLVAIEALVPKINEAYTYYNRNDYKDDKFAKGKAMHPALWAANKAFDKAGDAFSDAIETENDKFLDAELKEVEAHSGKKLLWHKMVLTKQAKALLPTAQKETFDVAKMTADIAAFTTHVDATIAYAAAHKTEEPIMWSLYESAAKDMLEAFKERMRRVRDKEPYNTGEQALMQNNPGLVRGSSAKCGKAYNQLIQRGNGLTFKE